MVADTPVLYQGLRAGLTITFKGLPQAKYVEKGCENTATAKKLNLQGFRKK
ncbi:hypothetical protein SPFM12_00175 [Salmonella phage SPFM12]|nr:hypothetical protein SPFM12_00175 [Salmonella phage SPFM12]